MALNRGKCTRISSRSRSQPRFAVGRGNVGRANVLGVPFSLLAAIATNDIAILRKISFIFFSKMYNNWQPAFNYSIMYNYLVNGVNHNILLPKFTKSTHVVLSVFFKYLLFKIRKITSRYFENMPLNEIFLAKYPEIHSIFECQFHPIKIIGHSIFLASPT